MAKRRPRRHPVIHPTGLAPALLAHHARKPRPAGAVTAGELERDVLHFIADRYSGRHLDIVTAQLGLSNAAHKMIVAHLREVAASADENRRRG